MDLEDTVHTKLMANDCRPELSGFTAEEQAYYDRYVACVSGPDTTSEAK